MTMPPWTYSRLESFETCPKKFYHLMVAKDFVDPENEHSRWGKRVHLALEERVRDGKELPEGMTQWEGLAKRVVALPGIKLVEYRLAIDDHFRPVEWKEAWCRGIGDVIVKTEHAVGVIDWKTGKRKPSEQLDLYGALAIHTWPDVSKVETKFIWLKEKKFDGSPYTSSMLPAFWGRILPRVERLQKAYAKDVWPANPSGLCRGWCPVKTCKYNSKR